MPTIKANCPCCGGFPCCDCAATPLQWRFTLAGVTPSVPSACFDCNAYNTTWTLSRNQGEISCPTDTITSTCCWDSRDENICGEGGPTWILGCDDTFWWLWTSPIATIPVVGYKKSKATWNCLGVNIMTVDLETDVDCSTWPATVTLVPV